MSSHSPFLEIKSIKPHIIFVCHVLLCILLFDYFVINIVILNNTIVIDNYCCYAYHSVLAFINFICWQYYLSQFHKPVTDLSSLFIKSLEISKGCNIWTGHSINAIFLNFIFALTKTLLTRIVFAIKPIFHSPLFFCSPFTWTISATFTDEVLPLAQLCLSRSGVFGGLNVHKLFWGNTVFETYIWINMIFW